MTQFEEIPRTSEFDTLVGQVAGAVCGVLMELPTVHQRHFVLLPAVTYKVKLCLARSQWERRWTDRSLPDMAADIRAAIVPLMWAFDFDADAVYALGPRLEFAALQALKASP